MNKLLSLILVLLPLKLMASIELKVGDVLLQPLHCWSCSLIEAEEDTIYSHIGIVIAVLPEIRVAEAFGKVKNVSLEEFNKKTEKGQALRVLRFKNDKLVDDMQVDQPRLMNIFSEDFEGLLYDAEFRWNNFDPNGRQKLYCSELVSKLLQAFKGLELPIKRMHFNQNRDAWRTFFKGNIPDNEWGNSPGDYERSDLFYALGDI